LNRLQTNHWKLVSDVSLPAISISGELENPDQNQEEDVNPLEMDKHVLNDMNAE
jgi:hypothetical protein